MIHPMLSYWRQAFEKHHLGDDRFFSSEMPDPILSPHFFNESPGANKVRGLKYFNVIAEKFIEDPQVYENFKLRNHHFLCQMGLHPEKFDEQMVMEPLEFSKKKQSHQDLLKDAFPQDFEFLKKLEDFLPTLNAKYYVGTLFNEDKVAVGSVTLGVTGEVAVLLSGMIHSEFRDQKLSRRLKKLIRAMGNELGVINTFYWTKEKKLTGYADQVGMYCVYVRPENS